MDPSATSTPPNPQDGVFTFSIDRLRTVSAAPAVSPAEALANPPCASPALPDTQVRQNSVSFSYNALTSTLGGTLGAVTESPAPQALAVALEGPVAVNPYLYNPLTIDVSQLSFSAPFSPTEVPPLGAVGPGGSVPSPASPPLATPSPINYMAPLVMKKPSRMGFMQPQVLSGSQGPTGPTSPTGPSTPSSTPFQPALPSLAAVASVATGLPSPTAVPSSPGLSLSSGDVSTPGPALTPALASAATAASSETVSRWLEFLAALKKAQAQGVSEIVARGRQLGDEEAKLIAKEIPIASTWRSLILSDNQITAEGIRSLVIVLASNGTLRTVDLGGNSLGPTGAQYLAAALRRNKTLTELKIGNNDIRDQGIQALASVFAEQADGVGGCGLISLDVSNNRISDAGGKALAGALLQFPTLTSLNLDSNDLTDDFAKPLATLLASNTIRSVSVSRNQWSGADGVRTLAQALGATSALTALAFSSSRLATIDGMKVFAQGLSTNVTLHALSLPKAKLSDETLRVLLHGLALNSSLTKLSLAGNKIGPDGGRALAERLEMDSRLVELDVSRNRLADAGLAALASALRTNFALTTLDVDQNRGVTLESIKSFEQAIGMNYGLTRLAGVDSARLRTATERRADYSPGSPTLTFASQKLTTIPLAILPQAIFAQPTLLQTVNLFNNHCVDVPDWIPKLPLLTTLILTRNRLVASASLEAVMTLTTLTRLDLRANRLTTLPSRLGDLTRLQYLAVSFNQLATLPPSVGELRSLEELHLFDNQLELLPAQLHHLPRLALLDLRQNSLRFLLESALPKVRLLTTRLHFEKLFQYLRLLGEGEPVKLDRCKLVLVGNANVGKTSVRKALAQACGGPTATQENVLTDGIDIEEMAVKEVLFEVYDFAGQELYYTTHQFFLTEKAIYVCVFKITADPEERMSTVEYWLKSIRLRAPYAPIIVVGTHLDEAPSLEYVEEVRAEVKSAFKHYKIDHFLFVAPNRVPATLTTSIAPTGAPTTNAGANPTLRSQQNARGLGNSGGPALKGPGLTSKASTSNLSSRAGDLATTAPQHSRLTHSDPSQASPLGSSPPIPSLPVPLTVPVATVRTKWKALAKILADLAQKRRLVGLSIPKGVAQVIDYIHEFRKTAAALPIVPYEDFVKVVAGYNNKDIPYALDLLHNLGVILHFKLDPLLADLVVLSPQFLADLCSSVVTLQHSLVKEGRIRMAEVHDLFRALIRRTLPQAQYSPRVIPLLEKFEILFRLPPHRNDAIEESVPAQFSPTTALPRPSSTPKHINSRIRLQ